VRAPFEILDFLPAGRKSNGPRGGRGPLDRFFENLSIFAERVRCVRHSRYWIFSPRGENLMAHGGHGGRNLPAVRKSNGSRGAWWPESPRGEKIQWLTGGTGGGRNLPAVRKSNGPRGMLNRVRRLSSFKCSRSPGARGRGRGAHTSSKYYS